MTKPSAKIVLDSRHAFSGYPRATTMEVVIPRIVLAELNTHRVFSRNSASSRAIPLKKQLERVRNDCFVPLSFPAEQKGMQGGDELDPITRDRAEQDWLRAATDAANHAEQLGMLGVHKSIANRLIEPFLWHTVIITATDWENFWEQRCSPLAQPEIRVAAEAMRAAYEASVPQELGEDDWHLPFVTGYDWPEMVDAYGETDALWLGKQVSAARCARVSSLTHDGVRDWRKDVELSEKLVSATPAHRSPLEHVCRPTMPWETQTGTLRGWRQFRHMVMEIREHESRRAATVAS